MGYIENPKTKDSGILCAIPQTGTCPVGCADCFFQSGRSFLEPLDENLPNLPDVRATRNRIVRMNDGNDSNVDRMTVVQAAKKYEHVFFNTSIPRDLETFPGPVVLTVNPGGMTDTKAHLLDNVSPNLMFVRVRANTWNLDLVDKVVYHYASTRKIPVVLTFMAYYSEGVKEGYEKDYSFRKRTLNSYHVINPDIWEAIMSRYEKNPNVHACGKDPYTFACKHCGNCLREYYATMVKCEW